MRGREGGELRRDPVKRVWALLQCGPMVFDVAPGRTYWLRIASTTSLSALNTQVVLTVVFFFVKIKNIQI